MTNRDFLYWVQGYFELTAPDHCLSSKQSVCILKHLEMVKQFEKLDDCNAFIEGLLIGWAMHTNTILPEQVKVIKDRVHKQFKHVIDPMDPPAMQNQLNQIHHGTGFDNVKIRC